MVLRRTHPFDNMYMRRNREDLIALSIPAPYLDVSLNALYQLLILDLRRFSPVEKINIINIHEDLYCFSNMDAYVTQMSFFTMYSISQEILTLLTSMSLYSKITTSTYSKYMWNSNAFRIWTPMSRRCLSSQCMVFPWKYLHC